MDVSTTTAIVTGGASGLGLATVQRLHRAGAAVVIIDLPGSAGATIADDLGERARFAPADVTDPEAVTSALDTAAQLGRPLRVVVNCAGIGPPARVVGRKGAHPLDLFRTVVEINLIGTFNVTRLAAERILAEDLDGEERGVIVNTASVAAFDGQIGQAAYAASKGGIVSMTLPIARELAERQIRVVTIAPGLFETPLLAGLPDDAKASLGTQVPHPARLGHPDEYAQLVEHIVANPMLNGETIRLDGAIRMTARQPFRGFTSAPVPRSCVRADSRVRAPVLMCASALPGRFSLSVPVLRQRRCLPIRASVPGRPPSLPPRSGGALAAPPCLRAPNRSRGCARGEPGDRAAERDLGRRAQPSSRA